MVWLFLSLSILFNLFFFFMWNPLSLGMMLIIQTLILSVTLGFISTSFWFLYLLILVFIGGMLVLFIYITSIFPNEKFSFNQFLTLTILMIFSVVLVTFLMINNFFMLNLNLNNCEYILDMKTSSSMINTIKMFSSQNNILLIFLVNYLFYCMIIVIKLTNYFTGPLRKMN